MEALEPTMALGQALWTLKCRQKVSYMSNAEISKQTTWAFHGNCC